MFVSIILAAGLSTRFPGNKLLYVWNGKPVIRWTVENALNSNVDRVIVVTGHDRDRVLNALEDLCCYDEIYNENYREGMSGSVKAGVRHAIGKYGNSIEAILFTPGDCAWIPPVIYDLMIMKFKEEKPLILVASYRGRKGHPILFDASLTNDLLMVSEETRGLKFVVKKNWWGLKILETNYPGVILDIDTYNDLNRIKYMIKK
ncbi:MAG: nucleotidyl transferase [Desulfurococcales archaeon ex4484_58]|nr:MAG: nucleotidyl transferase [Desulfurococcales archaeon ex4484_58]